MTKSSAPVVRHAGSVIVKSAPVVKHAEGVIVKSVPVVKHAESVIVQAPLPLRMSAQEKVKSITNLWECTAARLFGAKAAIEAATSATLKLRLRESAAPATFVHEERSGVLLYFSLQECVTSLFRSWVVLSKFVYFYGSLMNVVYVNDLLKVRDLLLYYVFAWYHMEVFRCE